MNEHEYLDSVFAALPAESLALANKLSALTERVEGILEQKGWALSDLAKCLGEGEAEVNNWLYAPNGITLRNVVRLEKALEAPLLEVPDAALPAQYAKAA